ncbi:hypothetical protein H311_02305, partial [Anncaliia algerae PRA109]
VVKDIANAQENIKSLNLNVSSLGNGNSKVERNIPLQEFKLVQENNTYNVQASTKPKIYKYHQITFGNGNKISKEYAAGKDNHESLDIPYQPSDKTRELSIFGKKLRTKEIENNFIDDDLLDENGLGELNDKENLFSLENYFLKDKLNVENSSKEINESLKSLEKQFDEFESLIGNTNDLD